MGRCKHQVLRVAEHSRIDDRCYLLALLERQKVYDRGAAGVARPQRELVNLQAVDLALRGEEHHVVVGRSYELLLHEVFGLEVHAADALAAAMLLAVGTGRQSLNVARLRDGDDHVLLGDEVLDVDILGCIRDVGPPLVGVLRPDLCHFIFDDAQNQGDIGENLLVPRDLLTQLGELIHDFPALEAGEATQSHLEDGIALRVAQTETLGQTTLCLNIVGARSDDGDNLVNVVQRDDETLEDVGALASLAELVLGAPGDDLFLVLYVVVQHLL